MQRLMFALVLALASSVGVAAEPWPAKPLHLVVPFPAGSSPDLVARTLSERLAQALGQPVIVENKPGAGGNLGTALVAKAEPDGYTLGLSIPGPLAVNTVLYQKMEYDPFTELAPITLVALSPNMLIVNPGLGVNSVQEFIAHVKARPGKLNYGSVGNGSASHLTMELLKMQAGLDIVHIPYPGSPQVNAAILSNQIQAGFVVPGTAMPLVQSGRVKALAVTSSARSPVLPGLPTVAEAGFPGFESSAWLGMVAPARTPEAIVDRLNQELVAIIHGPELAEKLQRIYFQPVGSSAEALARQMQAERARWAKVIKQTGARVD